MFKNIYKKVKKKICTIFRPANSKKLFSTKFIQVYDGPMKY